MLVLVCLAERAGEVVPKETLIRAVWADTFVTDDVLTRCVSDLRKAFDDDAKGPRVIQTIPKSGYRLIAPVEGPSGPMVVAAPDVAAGETRLRMPWMRRVMVSSAAFLLLAFVVVLEQMGWRDRLWPLAKPEGRVMLAVLPFVNLSGDTEQEYFSDGLTEEMIAQLGALHPERLGVIARTSVMQYKGSKKSARHIGRELGVDYLLEGSVQRAGNNLRITAQLIRVSDQTHLWSRSFNRDQRDILLVRSEVSQAVASQIQLRLTQQQRARLAQTGPIHPQAYEAYLRGRYFLSRGFRNREEANRAVELFHRAIDLEPNYAKAYAGLADTHLVLAGTILSRPEDLGKARAAVGRAMQLDESSGEAHATLAQILETDFDWMGARREYERALELNPNYSTAHRWYALHLAWTGRHEEALTHSRRMLELDPTSLVGHGTHARVFLLARRYDEAAQKFKQALEMDPTYFRARQRLGTTYCLMGRFQEALAEMEEATRLAGNHPLYRADLASCYALAGRHQDARRILRELEPVSASSQGGELSLPMASAYAVLGNHDKAFELLEKGFVARDLNMIAVEDPRFDPLRSDRRFQDLLRRMNWPNVQGSTH